MNRARLALSLAGFGVAVMGIARNDRQLIWIAALFLGASLALRVVAALLRRRQSRQAPPD